MKAGGSSISVKNEKRLRTVAVLLALVGVLAAVFLLLGVVTLGGHDPLFRGKPESEWIKNLKYRDDQQVEEWRTYGEEGVQVLVSGLEHANRPGERAYRQLYRRMPGFLMRWVPAPKDDSTRAKRMELVSLLASLGNDAKSATPTMIQTLKNDEDDSVRQSTINFFTTSEDERCLLNQLPPEEKKQLLPALIRAMQNSGNWGLRNNAANALTWFPEQREIVAPVLTNAIHDPQPQVALAAAAALNRVAPDLITNVGVVPIVVQILKNPDDQIAFRAAGLLGQMRAEPSIAVPALINSLQCTNELVACDSAQALTKFVEQADIIIPALEQATQRADNASGWAKRALKQLRSAAAKQGQTL